MVKTRAGHAPSLRKLRKTTMRGLRAIGAPVESWRANNDLLEVILCSVSIVFGYGLASYISVLLYISAYSIYIKTNTEINELIYIYISLSLFRALPLLHGTLGILNLSFVLSRSRSFWVSGIFSGCWPASVASPRL